LRVGDRVLRVGDILLSDDIAQQTALAGLRAGRPVTLQVLSKDGGASERQVTPDEVPREQIPGLELQYGSTITDAGHRVRTIVSRPASTDARSGPGDSRRS
jgi:hypothetical protein